MASKTYTIHDKTKDLAHELRNDVSLKPIYLDVASENGATVLSLSRSKGDFVYCVSSSEHDNLLEYFRIAAQRPARSEKAAETAESTKRSKQCSLFSFIKK